MLCMFPQLLLTAQACSYSFVPRYTVWAFQCILIILCTLQIMLNQSKTEQSESHLSFNAYVTFLWALREPVSVYPTQEAFMPELSFSAWRVVLELVHLCWELNLSFMRAGPLVILAETLKKGTLTYCPFFLQVWFAAGRKCSSEVFW